MLQFLAQKCTSVLLDQGAIQIERKAVYVYGFELFWSTTLCAVSILAVGAIFDRASLSVTFLLFFMPVRTVAGGYHASSYGRCFALTNIIAALCVAASIYTSRAALPEILLWMLLALSFAFIWKEAPFVSRTHPLKEARILKNRKYTHTLIVIEAAALLALKALAGTEVLYTAVITSCIVAIMIMIPKRGERGV